MKRTILLPLTLMMCVASSWAQGPNNSGTYYSSADGKRGAELKTALCGIIYNRDEGGSLSEAYKALWTHFQTTDARPNGTVWDMYSNKREMDFGTDQDSGSGNQEGQFYNREHSFPNSWFGGKVMPMYTDLHHVYPTDKFVNNKRANYPFGENNGESYKSANDFSKLGKCTIEGYTGIVFEPNDQYKGDFARTYFYMVTCYEEKLADWFMNYADVQPTLDGSTYPGLSPWQLKMLMQWAKDDPVSEKETNRNNAVYGIQQNRNPFIDYPGLEDYIWGDKKGVTFSYDDYDRDPTLGMIELNATFGTTESHVIYDLNGHRIAKAQKGVNILRKLMSDGTVVIEKVLVK
jgi:endonuclease I